jgi:hypothetical protein
MHSTYNKQLELTAENNIGRHTFSILKKPARDYNDSGHIALESTAAAAGP